MRTQAMDLGREREREKPSSVRLQAKREGVFQINYSHLTPGKYSVSPA